MTLIAKFATADTKDKWLGYYTSLWGVGAMTGPIVGSALYSALGFELMFYVYGASEIVLALVTRHMIKNSPVTATETDKNEDLISYTSHIQDQSRHSLIAPQTETYRMSLKTDKDINEEIRKSSVIEMSQPKNSPVGYSQVLCSYRFFFALLTPFLWQVHFVAMEPILAQRLV